jgi:hypothetical protein
MFQQIIGMLKNAHFRRPDHSELFVADWQSTNSPYFEPTVRCFEDSFPCFPQRNAIHEMGASLEFVSFDGLIYFHADLLQYAFDAYASYKRGDYFVDEIAMHLDSFSEPFGKRMSYLNDEQRTLTARAVAFIAAVERDVLLEEMFRPFAYASKFWSQFEGE